MQCYSSLCNVSLKENLYLYHHENNFPTSTSLVFTFPVVLSLHFPNKQRHIIRRHVGKRESGARNFEAWCFYTPSQPWLSWLGTFLAWFALEVNPETCSLCSPAHLLHTRPDGNSEKHYLRHLESYGSNSVLNQITPKSYPGKIWYLLRSCAREDMELDQVWANDWDMENIIQDKTRKSTFVQPRKGQGDLWSLSIRWIRERNYGKAVSVWIKICGEEQ